MSESKEAKQEKSEAKKSFAELDLTSVIAPYLDRHMVYPLLEFLQEHKLYAEQEITQAKVQLAMGTKMADLAAEEYGKLHNGASSQEIQALRASALAELKELRSEIGPFIKLLDDKEKIHELKDRKMFTMNDLQADYQVKPSQLDTLYKYGRLMFDGGRYQDASWYLNCFRALSKDEEKRYLALWGRVAAEILMLNMEDALEELKKLLDEIEKRDKSPALLQLQERSWLIHWSLFIFVKIENGPSQLIDFFLQDRLLNAIQTTCPHMLRYLAASIIINKRRKTALRDVVRVIIQEKDVYSDPLTEFLRSLYSEFDFETAHKRLKEVEQLAQQDFFLFDIKDALMEQARQFVFETYARTHQCIDLSLLAKRLEIPNETAEQKVVELIRNVRVDVKIDSKKNQLVMDPRYPSIYQQVIDKTEGLTQRTFHLSQQIDKRLDQ